MFHVKHRSTVLSFISCETSPQADQPLDADVARMRVQQHASERVVMPGDEVLAPAEAFGVAGGDLGRFREDRVFVDRQYFPVADDLPAVDPDMLGAGALFVEQHVPPGIAHRHVPVAARVDDQDIRPGARGEGADAARLAHRARPALHGKRQHAGGVDPIVRVRFGEARQIGRDTDRLKQYVEKLQKTAIGPDGLVTKLDRVQTALRYLMRDVPKYKTSDAAMKTIERVGLWKAGFRTAKITHTRDKAAREVDTTDDDMQALKELIHSKIAKTKVETIVNRGKSSDEDINFIATYLFICFGYKNFQRAGPAINMTLKEVAEATYVGEDEDTMLKIIVSNHKTAKTYGPAVLYLSLDDSAIFNHYIEEIRPNIATSAECDIALLRANGLSFRNNYSHIIRAYAIEVGLTRIPSLTAVRKAGAVTGRAVLSNPEMEAMSRQMSHSSATSELYYRVRKGGKQSLSAFKSMQMLTGK